MAVIGVSAAEVSGAGRRGTVLHVDLVTFTRTLAAEPQGRGMRAMGVVPAVVTTEFHPQSVVTPPATQRAEEVADAIVRGYELGEVVCVPGLKNADPLQAIREAELGLLVGVSRQEVAAR